MIGIPIKSWRAAVPFKQGCARTGSDRKKHGNQKVHIHPSGWLSGVIYLKVVPTLGKYEGAIEFGLNGKRYSHVDSPTIIHQPKLGDIVFFPSSLNHSTIPFSTDTDRIIVSFDLLPNLSK